ncbi:MAG: MATE family efflux transporter, partial [bacterium]
MLGHLEDIRFLAGVALSAILFEFVYWTFGFLRMSTTGMTAQAVGRDDQHGLHLILFRSLLLALIFSAIIILAQKLIAWVGFGLLSGTAEVEAAGRDYFFARIWGAPAALCNFVFLGWFLGREKSNYALYMTIVANVANVILDYVFLFVLNLAAFGAGLATMISQYLSLFVAIFLFLKMKGVHFIRWREIVNRRELVKMLKLNVDITIRTFGLISAFAVFMNFSATIGVRILAANAVLLRILDFAAYFIDGAAFATESLGGIFYGQKNVKLLKWVLRYSLIVGELFALA